MSTFLGVMLAVVTGIASSIIFWYLQFRVFRTKLKISPTIAHYTYRQGGIRNQLKIRNVSRRDVVEVSVTIRAVLPDLIRPSSQTVITLGEWRRPVLKNGDEVQYQVRPEFMPEDEQARHIRQSAGKNSCSHKGCGTSRSNRFPEPGTESYIEVYVFGTDSVSGARGFAAQRITAQEIRPGAFLPGSFEQTGQFDTSAISAAPSS